MMTRENIQVRGRSGSEFTCYLAVPSVTPAPGIVLLQEIFGVNATMRQLADEYASRGFVVITPDLFWRQQPGVQLDAGNAADRDAAMKLLQGLDQSLAVQDADDALGYLRSSPRCNGKVAAVGYCLGGRLVYLMAARTSVDASVAYYGIGLEKALDEAGFIRNPLLLHIAEKDRLCPPEAREAILKGILPYTSRITAHVYPGANHAFARAGGADFDAAAAKLAADRTAQFLAGM
jgi:carboxymethylenebutenolidase